MRLKTTDQAARFDELGVRMCCRVQVWDQDKATVILFLWLCSASLKTEEIHAYICAESLLYYYI